MIYIIGSLRSPRPREIASILRLDGHEVFDDWQAAGKDADDRWRDYEQERGYTFLEALARPACQNVFQFDKKHLDRADAAVLVMPAGKSAFSELCYVIWKCQKPGFILLDDLERWDVMFPFFTDPDLNPGGGVFDKLAALRSALGACVGPLRDAPQAERPALHSIKYPAYRVRPFSRVSHF